MNKKQKELLIKWILIMLVVFIISILLIKRFLYFRPSSHFMHTKERYKVIQYQHLNIWSFDNPNSFKVLLYFHGNSGNLSHYANFMSKLHQLGYNVVSFDYSGFGKSNGVPSEKQCYEDGSIIFNMLLEHYKIEDIILYGCGLGASIATYIARQYSVPKLILESPLPSIRNLIEYKYPLISFLSFIFPEFNTELFILGYNGKSLMFHSVNDETIPFISTIGLQKHVTTFIKTTGSHKFTNIPLEEIHRFIESGS